MRHQNIWYVNWILISVIVFSLFGTAWHHATIQEVVQPPVQIQDKKPDLPSTFFTPKSGKLASLDTPALKLEFKAPAARLPDLRNYIFYYGHNLRPDAKDAGTLFFSLGPVTETNPSFSVKSKEKLFLVSQENREYPFALSPANRPTAIWFEPTIHSGGASIEVRMKDKLGLVVGEPKDRAQFILTEKPLAIGAGKSFMLDQFRADATLFSRQKAKWLGPDLFLDDHGGLEFEPYLGKQRIQFGEGEDLYSVYLDKDDIMVWKEGKWVVPEPGMATAGYPLARVTKIEERTMSVELFDVAGRHKVMLTLLKLQEPNVAFNLSDFDFIGARTRIHSMFFIGGQREIVGPDDWFLKTQEGWKKLKTSKEIDAYVTGLTPGDLLVVNKIEKINETQWLQATLYSQSRSKSETVMIPLKVQGNEMNSANSELIQAIPQG